MVTSIHPKIPPASKIISGRWLDQKGIRNNTHTPYRDNKDNCHIRNKYVHTYLEVHANLKIKYTQTHKAYVRKTNYISKYRNKYSQT